MNRITKPAVKTIAWVTTAICLAPLLPLLLLLHSFAFLCNALNESEAETTEKVAAAKPTRESLASPSAICHPVSLAR